MTAWGSATHHQRYSQPKPRPHRKRCPYCWTAAGVRKSTTHLGMANGVCLMSGCELHVRRWVKTGRPRS